MSLSFRRVAPAALVAISLAGLFASTSHRVLAQTAGSVSSGDNLGSLGGDVPATGPTPKGLAFTGAAGEAPVAPLPSPAAARPMPQPGPAGSGQGLAGLGASATPMGARPMGAQPMGAQPMPAQPAPSQVVGSQPMGAQPTGPAPRPMPTSAQARASSPLAIPTSPPPMPLGASPGQGPTAGGFPGIGGPPGAPMQVIMTPNGSSEVTPIGGAGPDAAPGSPDAAPKLTPFQSALDTVLTDDDANHQVENMMRKIRVLDAQQKVEKQRLDILKAQSDIKKLSGDQDAAALARFQALHPPPPPPPPVASAMPAMPSLPDVQRQQLKSTVEDDAARLRRGSTVATISVAGPRDALRALVRVAGYGDVTVREGGVLPGDIKVVSVAPAGVTVRKGSGPSVLVPFIQ